MQLLIELAVSGTLAGIKIGIAALGFALIFYATKEMHFAFGAISVAAAYVCYWTVSGLGGGAASIALGIVTAFAFAMLLSIGIHKFVYLRLRSVMPVVMSSLGISLLVENIVQMIGSPDTQILIYDDLIRVVDIGPVHLRMLEIWLVIFFILITVGIDIFMNLTRIGQGFAATIEDAEMAELVGIRTARMRVGAYCAGAALGAFSGLAMLVDTGLRPAQGFILLLYALIITIMGRGNLRAVAIWAVLFGVLRSLWSWKLPTEFQELAMFALMMSYLIGRDAWDRYQRNRLLPLPTTPDLRRDAVVGA
jgi:branched-chain amino acid transport system permease protein